MALQQNKPSQDIFDSISDEEIKNPDMGLESQNKDIFDSIPDEEVFPIKKENPSFVEQAGEVLSGAFDDTVEDAKQLFVRAPIRTARTLLSGTVGTAAELANLAVNPFAQALGADSLAEATQTGEATQSLKSGFDSITGGLGKPQNETEEMVDTAGEFASSLLIGGGLGTAQKAGGIASKGLEGASKLLGAQTAGEVVGAATAGAASEALRQKDVQGLGQIIGTISAGVIGSGLTGATIGAGKALAKSSLGKKIGSGFDVALEAFGLPPVVTENLLKIPEKDMINLMSTPKEIRFQNLKQLSEQEGIQLPLSVLTENNMIKGAESLLSATPLAGNFYSKMTSKIVNKFQENYNNILDDISRTTYNNAFEAGEAGLSQLKNNRELAAQKYGALYDRAFESIPENASIKWVNTKNSVDKVISQLEKREVKSQETQQTINNLSSLQKSLNLGEGVLPVDNLVQTKISMNELIDFERVGTTKALLKNVLSGLNKDIEQYAKTNPEFGQNYKRANELFGDAANRLRSDVASSLLKQDRPEYVLAKMNNVSNLRKVEDALSMNKNGKDIFNSLKREKLKEILTDKFVNKATGEFSLQRFSSTLSENSKNNELIKELMGDNNFRKINNLQNLASEIVNSSSKFANPSGTAQSVQLVTATTSMINGLLTGNLALVALPLLPFTAASILTNPRFINSAAKTLNAVKNQNMKSFNKERLTLLSIIEEEKEKNEQQ